LSRDGGLAGVDSARRADAVGGGLDDELLGGGVELGVVVLAIGANERVRSSCASVLTRRFGECAASTTIAFVLGP
jgi:hypothetical protein